MTENDENKGSLGVGLLVSGGVNLGVLVLAWLTLMLGVGAIVLMGFGLLQFLWLLPFYLKYKNKGESDTCKGILLGGELGVAECSLLGFF